ncbi:MAG: dihydrolipoamide acetyltransferase family protein [Chlamydiales bacterium]
MTKIVEITLPKLGESIVGATIVQWLKQVGEPIAHDEPLVEVATDKVNSEIPSPTAGILKEIITGENEEVEVGALLAKIEVSETMATPPPPQNPPTSKEPEEPSQRQESFFSPAVLRLAHIEGIEMETLRKINGTGEGGRVTKKDVQQFIQASSSHTTATVSSQEEERIPLCGVRRKIAENMVRSFYEAPHASLVLEADVTDVMELIAREKQRFKETHGVKLTITSFLIHMLAKTIQKFPMLNASLENDTIVMKRYVNVGIAVNIDKGLVVPVIKNCQDRNLVSIAKAVVDLSNRAREGKLAPDEVADGTITLTNFGMAGALIGVPIIRYPEVAIIGAGKMQKRVIVREDNSLAVRQMIYLTLTFDHRLIDGIYGCEFLDHFKSHLESVSLN